MHFEGKMEVHGDPEGVAALSGMGFGANAMAHDMAHEVKHMQRDMEHALGHGHAAHGGIHVDMGHGHGHGHHGGHEGVHVDLGHGGGIHLDMGHGHSGHGGLHVDMKHGSGHHGHGSVGLNLGGLVGGLIGAAEHLVSDLIDSRNRLWVELSKVSYTGGETVQGTVFLSCVVPFSANGVTLKLKGYERAHWEEWKTKEGQAEGQPAERYIHEHKENREFFCERIPVYPHSGLVQQGEYNFPFQYTLPPSLPGTFYEKGGHWANGTGYAGSVVYYLKAKVDVTFRHSLHQKISLVINESLNKNLEPSFGKNDKTFLMTKGRLAVQVMLDRNCYFPGNTVIAKVEANNTSVKKTNEVNVKVYRLLELKAHGHHWKDRKEIYHQHYPGFEPSFYGVRWLPFQVPMNVQPSTTTANLVHNHYFFVVECAIPGAINLNVELPTKILAPQWLWSSQPQAPPQVQLPPDVSFRPPWQADNTTSKCTSCVASFTLLKRRHHCRGCGKIFCGACVTKTSLIESLGYVESPVRVCDSCHTAVFSGGLAPFAKAAQLPSGPSEEYMPSAPLSD